MLVRFLRPTPYTPTAADSPRCWGQLRLRPTVISAALTLANGTAETQTKCGPMERYFPVGSTPELTDEVAAVFIESGAAEAFQLDVQYVSAKEIMQDVKVY